MKGFKGFDPDFKCRGKQYAENEIFEENSAEICASGMHFCKYPLDVLAYYPLINENGEFNTFAPVEALADAETDDNKKYCTTKLKIGAKLEWKNFISISAEATREVIEQEAKERVKGAKSGGDYATLAGGYNATVAGGDYATLAGGYNAKLAGGNNAKLAGGDHAKLAGGCNATLAGGYNATVAGGDYATLAGGYNATLAGGNNATLAGGNHAKLAGGGCAIIVGDHGSIAKGGINSVLVLVRRDGCGNIVDFAARIVDGERIKADTWYKLENGEFVEVET